MDVVRLWNADKEALDKVFAFFKEKLGPAIAEAHAGRGPAKLLDVLSSGLRFPRKASSNEEAAARVREGFEKYFEEEWLYRPLKSLGGAKPVDAPGDPLQRKKLRGVLQYLKECGELTKYPYDFDRLAAKGLAGDCCRSHGRPQKLDIAALGAGGELAGPPRIRCPPKRSRISDRAGADAIWPQVHRCLSGVRVPGEWIAFRCINRITQATTQGNLDLASIIS